MLPILEEKRREIDKLDNELLKILAKRFIIAREIGVLKKQANQNTIQPERWNEILKARISEGGNIGLDKKFIEDIFSVIHQESVRWQNSEGK